MSRIPEKFVPNGVLVTDNGGPNRQGGTHDRFTVVMPDGACYSMSTNVMAPTGVCQYQGNNVKPDPAEQKRERIPLHVYRKIQELMV